MSDALNLAQVRSVRLFRSRFQWCALVLMLSTTVLWAQERRVSFDMPEYTGDITGLGTMRLLEAIRRGGCKTRFYQASSSEMFGSAPPPQGETTVFQPRSPYAAAKVYAYWMTRIYREGHGLFASNGILFNHESPRRGETFVTRKITRAVAAILAGRQDTLFLGNLDAKRDWGYAPEYVEAMWQMLQQDAADDFVIGTGEAHTVREFVEEAFTYAGLDWQKYVKTSERYLRPLEVDSLIADTKKALEGGEVEAINRAADALTQASHKVAEAMYKTGAQPGADAGASGNGAGSGAKAGEKTDDVIDAEYVDADEKKKE